MNIFVTGDTHRTSVVPGGRTSGLNRLAQENLDTCGINPSDLQGALVLFAGDLGWIFNTPERDEQMLDYLQEQATELGCTLAGIDGNHDFHDGYKQFPTVSFHNGTAHQLRPDVFYLPRGEGYVIDGFTIAVLGGAHSIDKDWRIEGKSWWPTEIPNWDEEQRFCSTVFDRFNGKVDLILTHTCPPAFAHAAGFANIIPDSTMDILQNVYRDRRLSYGLWAVGHWHTDCDLPAHNARLLLDDVVRVH